MDVLGRFLSKLGFPAIQSHTDLESPAQAAAIAGIPPEPVLPSSPSQSSISGAGRSARHIKNKPALSTPASCGVKKRNSVRRSPVADYKKSKRRKKPTDARPPSEETLAKRRSAVEKRKKTIAAKPVLDKEHVDIVTVHHTRMMSFTSGRRVTINSLEHQMALKFPQHNQYIRPVYLPPATGDCEQKRT
jgi:hypothetical protein